MKRHRIPLSSIACLLVFGTAHPGAAAEPPLADPTRPPGLVQAPVTVARAGSGVAAAPPTWPQLRSVQVSAQGQSSALLDGRVVRVGERLGDATVLAIDAQGVLLRRGRSEQRLALLPGLAKTTGASTAPAFASPMAAATKGSP